MPSTHPDVLLRWMVRSDVPGVLCVERIAKARTDRLYDGFEWKEADLLREWRKQNCAGLVAVDGATGRVVLAFAVYVLAAETMDVIKCAALTCDDGRRAEAELEAKLRAKAVSHRRRLVMPLSLTWASV